MTVRGLPGRGIRLCWAASVLTGALALAPLPGAAEPDGLVPATLTARLVDLVPEGASDPRVSYVYGSGHRGAWQFVAFLTWRTRSGQIDGGTTDLPALGASRPEPFPTDQATLDAEHSVGLDPDQLNAVIDRLDPGPADLALLSLELLRTGDRTLVACRSDDQTDDAPQGADRAGDCTRLENGRTERFADGLVDVPFEDGSAFAVRRLGARTVR